MLAHRDQTDTSANVQAFVLTRLQFSRSKSPGFHRLSGLMNRPDLSAAFLTATFIQ